MILTLRDLTYLLIFFAATYLMTAAVALYNREAKGAKCYTGLMVAASIYSIGYFFELRSPDLETALTWLKFEYTGIVFLSPMWLLFVVNYCEYSNFRIWHFIFIFIIPMITILLVLTIPAHCFFYKSFSIDKISGLSIIKFEKGIWYWVHILYSNILTAAGNFILVYTYIKSKDIFKNRNQNEAKRCIYTALTRSSNELHILI